MCVSSPNQPVLHRGAHLFLLDALFGSDSPLTAQSQFSGGLQTFLPPTPSPPSAPTPESPLPGGTGGSRSQVGGAERCWWLSLWGLLVWLGKVPSWEFCCTCPVKGRWVEGKTHSWKSGGTRVGERLPSSCNFTKTQCSPPLLPCNSSPFFRTSPNPQFHFLADPSPAYSSPDLQCPSLNLVSLLPYGGK